MTPIAEMPPAILSIPHRKEHLMTDRDDRSSALEWGVLPLLSDPAATVKCLSREDAEQTIADRAADPGRLTLMVREPGGEWIPADTPVPATVASIAWLTADAEEARAAVARVRAMHRDNGDGYCAADPFTRWPCPTARAVDEPTLATVHSLRNDDSEGGAL